ncbi:MAG: hypothetical protein ACXVEF_27825 [Polyangiales bacterium]
MKRAYVVAALGAVVGAFVTMAACSSDDSTPPASTKDSGTTADTSTSGDGTPGDDTATGDETSTTDTGSGGEGGTPKCPTAPKAGKLADLLDPSKTATKVIVNDGMKLTGVVATSIKFRTRNPKKAGDPCQYSFFVADANATFVPYSGIQVIAYASNAVAGDGGGASCVADDLIPNDVKPGDLINVTGTYTEFGPTAASCGAATPAVPPPVPGKMPQLFKVCELTRTAGGTVPAPADVTPADISQQTGTGDPLLKYAGGLVRIKTVTAAGAPAFGAFKITGSELMVTDNIYYRGAATAPTGIAMGTAFTSITGLSTLDFCTWSLAPSQCADMVPASGSVCPSGTSTDAGTSD